MIALTTMDGGNAKKLTGTIFYRQFSEPVTLTNNRNQTAN